MRRQPSNSDLLCDELWHKRIDAELRVAGLSLAYPQTAVRVAFAASLDPSHWSRADLRAMHYAARLHRPERPAMCVAWSYLKRHTEEVQWSDVDLAHLVARFELDPDCRRDAGQSMCRLWFPWMRELAERVDRVTRMMKEAYAEAGCANALTPMKLAEELARTGRLSNVPAAQLRRKLLAMAG